MPPRRRSKPLSLRHAAFGEAIRRRRRELGWTQEALADAAETDLRQVGGIERGTRNPTLSTIVRLADALDTDPGALVAAADRIVAEGGAEAQRDGSDDSAQTSSTTRSQSGSTPGDNP